MIHTAEGRSLQLYPDWWQKASFIPIYGESLPVNCLSITTWQLASSEAKYLRDKERGRGGGGDRQTDSYRHIMAE